MIYAIIFSLILHICILTVTIICNRFIYINNTYSIHFENNQSIVQLLPMNHVFSDIKLENLCSSEKKRSIHSQNSSELKVYKKERESYQKTHNISDLSNNELKINSKDSMNAQNHVLSEKEATAPITNNISQNITKNPNLIKYIHPEYPSLAKILGIEGELKIMYDIDHIGKVKNIRVLSTNSDKIFEESIKLAMRRWVYEKSDPKKNLVITFKFVFNTISVF